MEINLRTMLLMMALLALAASLFLGGCKDNSTETATTTLTPPATTLTPPATTISSLKALAGNPAPDFQLQDLNGNTISLSELRGSPVMLNFWATWCGPCLSEIPFLQQIYEEWRDRDLVLLTVNIKEDASIVRQFMQYYGYSLTVPLDTNGNVSQRYDITGIPTTFFIDADGIIQVRKVGSFLNKEAIEYYLSKIIPGL